MVVLLSKKEEDRHYLNEGREDGKEIMDDSFSSDDDECAVRREDHGEKIVVRESLSTAQSSRCPLLYVRKLPFKGY